LQSASFGKNQMLYNLGMAARDMESQKSVKKMIQKIDQEFDLVMIVEQLDESLILLKKLLCWETDDMVYFKVQY
jgi:galactosylceramide sulfotransferase